MQNHTISKRVEQILSERGTLWLVLALAAVLRILHVFSLSRLPSFDLLLLDSAFYSFQAEIIAAGNWLAGNDAFYMDPLYPYFLAVIYKIFGQDMMIVRLLQVALGVGTCALTALIGNRVAGRSIGTVAAFCMAVYAPAIHNEGEVEKTALGVFLITLALALALARSPASRFSSGICLALAILTRGNLLLLVPLGMLYFALQGRHQPSDESVKSGFRPLMRRLIGRSNRDALLFIVGIVLILGPILYRNHYLSGDWILTTAQAGANFYIGNRPDNSTGAYENVPFVRPYPAYEQDDFRKEAIARSGRQLSKREVSQFWFAEACRHIHEHPGFAAKVMLQKVALFLSDVELPDQSDIYFLRKFSPVLRLPLLSFGFLIPFAILGMVSSFRTNTKARLLIGYVLFYSASVILFFILSRYRLHVVPIIAVFAAMGAGWLYEQIKLRRYKLLCLAAAVLAASAMFSFLDSATFGIQQQEWVEAYEDMAYRYELVGEYQSADNLLREALQKEPQRSITLCQLGRVSQKRGKHGDAIFFLQKCLELDSNSTDAWYLLGKSFAASGDYHNAIECLMRELLIDPGHAEARAMLDKLQLRH